MALQSRHDDFFSPAAHRKRVLNGMYIHLLPLSPSSPVNSMFQYPLCERSSSPHFVALRSYMAPLDPRLSPSGASGRVSQPQFMIYSPLPFHHPSSLSSLASLVSL